MKHQIESLLVAISAFGACLFAGCSPPAKQKLEESVSIRLDTKEDGLAYAPGSVAPYTGEVVGFTSAGTRQMAEKWESGQSHGIWFKYWSNGQVKREDIHQRGSIIHRRQWYEDGTLKLDAEMKNGLGYGKVRLWWPDGRLRRSVLLGAELQPHGHVLEYAEDGTIIADAIFHHGQYISGKIPKDSIAQTDLAQAN